MHTRAPILSFLLVAFFLTSLIGCGGVTSPPTTSALPPTQPAPSPAPTTPTAPSTPTTPTTPTTPPTTTPPTAPTPPPTTPPTPTPPTTSPAPATQLIYVVLSPDNTTVNTYAVVADGTTATQVGMTTTLGTAANTVQLTADHRFLYTMGSGASNNTIAVYATDSSGAPRTPALQTTTVPLRTGFLIHPDGKFAYEMQPGPSDFLSIQSSLYLQPVDASTGKFNGNPQLLQSFGPAYTSESLNRFSKDGMFLYDEIDGSGPHASGEIAFRRSGLDPATGALTLGNVFWQYSFYNDQDVSRSTSFGDKLLAFARIDGSFAQNSGIGIFAVSDAASAGSPTALVQCTAQMLAACATTTDVRLHPSEQYVFATDSASSRVRVLRIDVANKQLVDTGNSIPRGTSDTSVAFSADGALVYAPANGGTDIQVYRFNTSSGALTPGAVIRVGSTFWMYPTP